MEAIRTARAKGVTALAKRFNIHRGTVWQKPRSSEYDSTHRCGYTIHCHRLYSTLGMSH